MSEQKKMIQQVMTAPKEITFREVPVPEVGPDQVLVKIKKIGICGSDIHVYHGMHPYTKYPVTQGHEVSGQIVKVGQYVNDLKEGQKVTIEPQVLITDISDYRLELAKKCGADFTVNTKEKEFGEAMVESFGPDKADVIYDCAGNDITMNQAIQNARKGSVIILVAVFAKMANVDLAKLNDSELDLNTTMMYRHADYVDAIRFVKEGKIQLKPLMSKHFAFADYLQAYQYIDDNRETTMKVLIDVDPSEE